MHTPLTLAAAMFAALGQQTKLSRSGYSIVFKDPQLGQNDLSGDQATAEQQLRAAGLEPDQVTPEQIRAYCDWRDTLYQARKIGQAKIIITRTYLMRRGREIVPANRVFIRDGWSNEIDRIEVYCREYHDSTALNRHGYMGAFCHAPDYDAIDEAITALRYRNLLYAAATVQDNNKNEDRT